MAALESSWYINLCWLRSRKILNRRVIEGFFSSPLNLVWPVSVGIILLLLQGRASFYGVTKGHSGDWLAALDLALLLLCLLEFPTENLSWRSR